MIEPSHIDAGQLVCAECGWLSDQRASGWRALVVSDDDELPLQDDDVVVLCPDCAIREFDGE
jgi:hypothetical protein